MFDLPAGFAHDGKKIVVFRVSRVWKSEVGETLEMPAVEETSASLAVKYKSGTIEQIEFL